MHTPRNTSTSICFGLPSDDDDVGLQYRFEFLTPAEIRERRRPAGSRSRTSLRLADSGPAMTEWLENTIAQSSKSRPRTKCFTHFTPSFGKDRSSASMRKPSQELEKVLADLHPYQQRRNSAVVLGPAPVRRRRSMVRSTTRARRFTSWSTIINKIGNGFDLLQRLGAQGRA